MISEAEFANLLHRFPALKELSAAERDGFRAAATPVVLDGGARVFEAGARCENFLWLTDGSVRVTATDGDGREILLYRVEPGELCVFTTSCALGHASYPAAGRTESATRAVVLPVGRFEDLVVHVPALRRLVFSALSTRLHEMMGLVESVAFHRLEQRVAAWLLREFESAEDVERSHQEIADELGSTREPISRVLAGFERNGWIELGRRRVTCRDREGLRSRA